MPSSELIKILRTRSHGLDPTVRFIVLDMCDRLERKMRDCELLAQRIVKRKWIPVTERLPQEDEPLGAICEQVQVLLSDGFVTTGWCNRGHRVWFYLPYGETRFIGNDYEKTPVIAWQPMAEPPKEVQK